MRLQSSNRGNIRFWLKSYLFFGVAVLILGVLVYSNYLMDRMKQQTTATTRLFGRFLDNVHFEVDDQGKLALLQEVMNETNLPTIVTVFGGRPIAWRHVPIDQTTDEDLEVIRTMDLNNPPPGKIEKLMELVREYDKVNRPIPIRVVGMDEIQGWVHFGVSPLERELRYMPLIQLGLFLLFMGVAIQGLRYLKISEERSIWVGMAKETAHQLGTPLSALLGWTQLLKDKIESGRTQELAASVQEMGVDLDRLRKVTERFSKIGSRPELAEVDIVAVLERTVSYFHRRLPRLKAKSTISLVANDCPPIRGNEELLEWVFENLIKNGLDALGDSSGTIEIRASCRRSKKHVEVYVKDTGRGIPPAHREQIFRPGFTTKPRGWGLGLALTRRIVEEYHQGSLRLVESRPGKGATFLVRLPVAEPPTQPPK
jgi:signal transduction histidine kinase